MYDSTPNVFSELVVLYLQSSLNHAEGLGTSGLAVLYAVFILTSVFVTAVVMSKFSGKWIITLSMVCYSTFLATGFYATWVTVIPATVVVGVGTYRPPGASLEIGTYYPWGQREKSNQVEFYEHSL